MLGWSVVPVSGSKNGTATTRCNSFDNPMHSFNDSVAWRTERSLINYINWQIMKKFWDRCGLKCTTIIKKNFVGWPSVLSCLQLNKHQNPLLGSKITFSFFQKLRFCHRCRNILEEVTIQSAFLNWNWILATLLDPRYEIRGFQCIDNATEMHQIDESKHS